MNSDVWYLRSSKRPLISRLTLLNYKLAGVRFIYEIYGCLTQIYLAPTYGRIPQTPVDLVPIRKADGILVLGGCPETVTLLRRWSHEPGANFRLVLENSYLMAFQRRKRP